MRKDAPWCPSNLEFIRRINDLPDIDAVRQTVFDASYLVMGLGDVYLGAPVACAAGSRHRLVTTNTTPLAPGQPKTRWASAALCVYGMEGPGGYQFVGRTLQMWNRYRTVPPSTASPGCCASSTSCAIRSAPMSWRGSGELSAGTVPLRIEPAELHLAQYQDFLRREAEDIAAFKSHQAAAFDAERQRWIDTGQAHFESDDTAAGAPRPKRRCPKAATA